MDSDHLADVQLISLTTGEVVAPRKVLRLATMVDAIVEELHAQPLDGASRARIRLMYRDALVEVGSTLSDPLLDELARLQPALRRSSDDELRIDISLLAGWLRGLRFGLATAEVPYVLKGTSPEGGGEGSEGRGGG